MRRAGSRRGARRLAARTDLRGARSWWTLFRTEAADANDRGVVWSDFGRTPRAAVLPAGDPTVPLNSCYVLSCPDPRRRAGARRPAQLGARRGVAQRRRRARAWRLASISRVDGLAATPPGRLGPRAQSSSRHSPNAHYSGMPPTEQQLLAAVCRAYRREPFSDVAPLLAWSHQRVSAADVGVSHLRGGELRAARARFAESLEAPADSATLGSIVLRPDQLRFAAGACGRTSRAMAAACSPTTSAPARRTSPWPSRESGGMPLVVAPASLRPTWQAAARRADVPCTFISHESLSRGVVPSGVVRRHRGRRVAPLPTDVSPPRGARRALRARAVADALRHAAPEPHARARGAGRAVPRRHGVPARRDRSSRDMSFERAALSHGPAAASRATALASIRADDGEVLRAILALPPPPRAIDSGDGGALLTISLVRAWASSRAALVATLRRRRQSLAAIQQCFEEGRVPTRAELRSWRGGGGVQLGFAPFSRPTRIERDSSSRRSRMRSTRERRALDALLDALARRRRSRRRAGRSALGPFAPRMTVRPCLRSANRRARCARTSPRCATARTRRAHGARRRIATRAHSAHTSCSRDSRLARRGHAQPAAHERVTLLLATDLLSEGVNLQDASVVVHLDLPWNPARLAQRLGRVRRPGGAARGIRAT